MTHQRTLIVVPTFKEASNIRPLVERVLTLFNDIDVLIVDDASPDGTAAEVRRAQQVFEGRLKLLERTGKGGRGSAVLAGFMQGLAEGYDLFFEMDADFSHDPAEIGGFLEKIKDYDMVLGSRYLPTSRIEKWGWKRTFFSRWANRYARFVLGIPISDYTNGFRCYRRSAIASIDVSHIDSTGYVVLSEVAYQLHKQGKRIGEIPTIFVNRRRGISNLSLHEILEAFQSVLRIRWRYKGVSVQGSARVSCPVDCTAKK
ncbi:MAG: polyprenol monophosphomannose synthase [Candidatus Peribacteraceae bacterium]|nr:polyprenol monophosphomannose synthase [Candidatus Peribacteraceae bacterium]